jgi:hypothetical protein
MAAGLRGGRVIRARREGNHGWGVSVFWVRPRTCVAPRGAFWSRTVLPTVARWFVQDARKTVDNFIQVQAA